MRPAAGATMAMVLALSFLPIGCFEQLPPLSPPGVGGLVADDFVRISLNGFDPADHIADINDYA